METHKKLLWILVMIAIVPLVTAHEVELVKNTDQCLAECYSIYKITARDTVLTLNETTFWFEFTDNPVKRIGHAVNVTGLGDFSVSYLTTINWTNRVPKIPNVICDGKKPVQNCTGTIGNSTYDEYNYTSDTLEDDGYTKTVHTKTIWKRLDEIKISPGDSVNVKIQGSKLPQSRIDNVLTMYNPENEKARDDGFVQYKQWIWWDSDFSNCRRINLTRSNTDTTALTNFPFLLTFNASEISSASLENGADIRFTNATGCNDFNLGSDRELPFEIEIYNNTDNDLDYVWVLMNFTGASEEKNITMFYNNPSAVLPDRNASNGLESVWAPYNYTGVWHLNTNGSDSTSYANDLTVTGVENITGLVGGAFDFERTDGGDELRVADQPEFDDMTDFLVASAWFNPESDTQDHMIIAKADVGDNNAFRMARDNGAPVNDNLRAQFGATTRDGNFQHYAGIWTYAVIQCNVAFWTININGTIDVSVLTSCGAANNKAVTIGVSPDGSLDMDGIIDEVRLVHPTGNYDKDRAQMEWSMITSPTSFINFNAEENMESAFAVNNETWQTPIYETSLANYTINVTWQNETYDFILGELNWNGTNYDNTTVTNVTSGNTAVFNISFRLPLISVNDTSISFNWTFTQMNTTANNTQLGQNRTQNLTWAYFISDVDFESPVNENTSQNYRINMTKHINDAPIFLHNLTIEYNGTNQSIASLETNATTWETWNVTLTTPLTDGNELITIFGWLNVSDSNFTFERRSNSFTQTIGLTGDGTENNETWVDSSLETILNTFTVNITTENVSVSQINFTYNNFVFTGTQIDNATTSLTSLFNISLRAPLVSANATSIEFYWNWTLSNNDNWNTSPQNQVVDWAIIVSEFNFSNNITESSILEVVNVLRDFGANLSNVSLNSTILYNSTTNSTINENSSLGGGIIGYTHVINNPLMGGDVSLTNETLTITHDGTITFNGTSLSLNRTGTQQSTQQKWRMLLVDCGSGSNNVSIYYEIRDAVTNNPITSADLTGIYTVFNGSVANNRSYTIVHTNDASPTVCQLPEFPGGGFLANLDLSYNGDGYSPSMQQISNEFLFVGTSLFNLTLLNSSNTQNITVHLQDESFNDLSQINGIPILISIELWNGTNFTFLTSDNPDPFGDRQFALDLNQEYRFNLTLNGTLLTLVGGIPASVGPFQILSSPVTFTILTSSVTGIGPLASLQLFPFNLTSVIDFEWNDVNNVSSSVLLEVTFWNATVNQTTVFSGTSTATAGNLSHLVAGGPLGHYIGSAYLVSNIDGETYLLDTIEVDTTPGSFAGTDGIFFVMIAIIVLVLLLSWNPTMAIIMAAVAMLGFWWAGMWNIAGTLLLGIAAIFLIIIIRLWKGN